HVRRRAHAVSYRAGRLLVRRAARPRVRGEGRHVLRRRGRRFDSGWLHARRDVDGRAPQRHVRRSGRRRGHGIQAPDTRLRRLRQGGARSARGNRELLQPLLGAVHGALDDGQLRRSDVALSVRCRDRARRRVSCTAWLRVLVVLLVLLVGSTSSADPSRRVVLLTQGAGASAWETELLAATQPQLADLGLGLTLTLRTPHESPAETAALARNLATAPSVLVVVWLD